MEHEGPSSPPVRWRKGKRMAERSRLFPPMRPLYTTAGSRNTKSRGILGNLPSRVLPSVNRVGCPERGGRGEASAVEADANRSVFPGRSWMVSGLAAALVKNLFQLERDCGILHLRKRGIPCLRLCRIVRRVVQGGTGERGLPCVANLVFGVSHTTHSSLQGGHAVGF